MYEWLDYDYERTRYSSSFSLHCSGMATVCCNSKSKATITDELSVSTLSPDMMR